MTYTVKEIFLTLQGEGIHAGRPAVFCRFSGCNLWSGREEDRETAQCRFCDTDFVGTDGINGGKFANAFDLAEAINAQWRGQQGNKLVVFTGGEPALQLDTSLIACLHEHQFEVAIETNGTLPLPEAIDWICMSPKAGTTLAVQRGNELKLVYPQPALLPEQVEGLKFDHFLLQPMDGPLREDNTRAAIEYCLKHPLWRLSIQTHKILQIP